MLVSTKLSYDVTTLQNYARELPLQVVIVCTIQSSSQNRTHTAVEGLHVEIEDVTRWHGVLDDAGGTRGFGAPGHGDVDAAAGDVDGLGRGEVGRAGHGLGGGACGDFIVNTLSFFTVPLYRRKQ